MISSTFHPKFGKRSDILSLLVVAEAALAWLPLQPGHDGRAFAAVVGLTAVLDMLVTQPSIPAVMTPLAGTLAEAAGLPVDAVVMLIVVGFSTVLLPYQTPPLVVAMQLGGVPMGKGNKLCLALFAVTVLVLLPLDFLWWRLLGWFG